MKQKQHTFQSLAKEVGMVLLASAISFFLSDVVSVPSSILPFVIVACYVVLKLIYHLCLFMSEYIITLPSLFRHIIQSDRQAKEECSYAATYAIGNNIPMKRMELFHYEYQHEEREYLKQKERQEDENCKLYYNTQETHSGNLTLTKKKSSKYANASDILLPTDKF